MIARLAVLPILIGPGPQVTASKVFAAVDETAALRRTLDVMSIDDYFFHDGGELANRALACGPDTNCIAKQLVPFDADLGLVVVINLELERPLLSVTLLDTKDGRVLAEAANQIDGGAAQVLDRLRADTAEMLDRLGHRRSGRITVTVDPPRALVAVDGARPDPGSPRQFTVEAGTYSVHASTDGYEGAETTAVVTAGQTTAVGLTLEPQTSVLSEPWFWTVGAVVVAGAMVGVGAAVLSTRTDCICVVTANEMMCPPCP